MRRHYETERKKELCPIVHEMITIVPVAGDKQLYALPGGGVTASIPAAKEVAKLTWENRNFVRVENE